MSTGTPAWLSYMADVGVGLIVLGLASLTVALIPPHAIRFLNLPALINLCVARPVYLLYLLASGEQEHHKHAA